jgi:hypothetical protein
VGPAVPTPKASKSSNPAKNLTGKQLQRIWSELKPGPLLERLRAAQPSARWSASGSRLKALCPFHDDNNPSFHVYLDRGYAKCFGCEKFVSNPLELWAKIRGIGWSDALTDLKQHFGLKFLSASANNQLVAWERHQLMKRRIAAICHDELINSINSPNDPQYQTGQGAVKYLIEVRKIPLEAIPALPMLGVVPPLARMMELLAAEADVENTRRVSEAAAENKRVQLFTPLDVEAKTYMQAAAGWVGAISFRYDTAPDTVGRFKLRRPNSKDLIVIDDQYEEEMGFYGLGWPMYRLILNAPQVSGFYLVEGEFDALSLMAQQVQAGGPGLMVIASGGNGSANQIETMRQFGFDEVYLVSDAPAKRGDELVESWLDNVKQLRSKVFVGYGEFPGIGDPDEMVLQYGLTAVQSALLDTKNKLRFAAPQDWVFEKAQPEIEAADETDVRYRVEVAAKWGRHLKNNIECDTFTELCNKTYGLPQAMLKREIVAQEEDEPAFVMRVASVLSSIFYVIGQKALDSDRRLHLWHKEVRKIVQISIGDDASVERELGAILGPSFQFFHDKVGVPIFLEVTDEKKRGVWLQEKDIKYRWYLRQALIILAQGAPDMDAAQHMGQGIHVIREPQGGAPTIYLVNGRDVYHGVFNADDKLLWTQLDGPAHNNYIFDVGTRVPEKPWLKWVHGTADLVRAETLDPNALWEKLHDIIDIGWRFKSHATTTDFLTSHLFATTVCSAFRRQVVVAFHADTRAGKSRMVTGLIGGSQFPRSHLIAAAYAMTDFTAAGIRQAMNNKTRPLCLDEFEDEGSAEKKGRIISEVYEMFRSLVGEDNAITQGSRGGEAITYRLNFFVFVAAINKARKSQDANRVITVNMERIDDKIDPVQAMMQQYGMHYLEELKKDLSVAMLPHIARIHRMYEEVEVEFGKAGAKPANIDSRIFEALYPAITVHKMLGRDYKDFIKRFVEANQETLSVSASYTDSMQLFDWICQSPKLKARLGQKEDRYDASLLQLLATPETRAYINVSGSGIFFDEASEIVVVNWTAAIQTVLSGHPRYGRETNVFNLRELANRAPNALKKEELERTGAIERLRNDGLVGVASTHLTAYRISHILRSLNPKEVTPEPAVASEQKTEKKEIDNGDFGV